MIIGGVMFNFVCAFVFLFIFLSSLAITIWPLEFCDEDEIDETINTAKWIGGLSLLMLIWSVSGVI